MPGPPANIAIWRFIAGIPLFLSSGAKPSMLDKWRSSRVFDALVFDAG